MLKPRIIDRYVAAEINRTIHNGCRTAHLRAGHRQAAQADEMVVNHGVGLGQVMSLIWLHHARLPGADVPDGGLARRAARFGRMSGDRELIAARACGISLYRLAIPVIAVALVVYALSSWFAFSIRPWANSNLQDELYRLTRTRSTAGLKEKIFDSSFPGLVLYVDHISSSNSSPARRADFRRAQQRASEYDYRAAPESSCRREKR